MIPRALSASFVVTVGGCASAPPEQPPIGHLETHNPPPHFVPMERSVVDVPGPHAAGVQTRQRITNVSSPKDRVSLSNGVCKVEHEDGCGGRPTCNPPAPTVVDCSPSAPRPAGKQGWYQTRVGFFANEAVCAFTGDSLCPPPEAGGGTCTPLEAIGLSCTARSVGGRLQIDVPSFEFTDAAGACKRVPAFSCPAGGCTASAMPPLVACGAAVAE